jgi:electron transport complex protein RnfC
LPQQLYRYAREQNHDQLHRHHLMDCIECGSCAYTCTSNIPLVQYFRAAKGEIHTAQREQQALEQGRRRQQARQARHTAKLAEKAAMRSARRDVNKAGGGPAATSANPPRAGGSES